MVDAAINQTRTITRAQALKKVDRDRQSRRPVNRVAYDPRLPNIQSIHFKYWRGMTRKNPYLAEVFPGRQLVAFKRQTNIRDSLVRSKVPPIQNRKTERDKRGMERCGKQCPACLFVKEEKFIKYNKSTWTIISEVNCETKNLVYLVECNKELGKEKYIDESYKSLKDRTMEHVSYIKSIFPTKATGEHFNLAGHSLNNMTITITEKVKGDEDTRKQRETHLI